MTEEPSASRQRHLSWPPWAWRALAVVPAKSQVQEKSAQQTPERERPLLALPGEASREQLKEAGPRDTHRRGRAPGTGAGLRQGVSAKGMPRTVGSWQRAWVLQTHQHSPTPVLWVRNHF